MLTMRFGNSIFAFCFAIFAISGNLYAKGKAEMERENSLNNAYFIDQLSPNANDENPGSEDKPFKTIKGALTKLKLKSGDSIWIKNGTYRESLGLRPEQSEVRKSKASSDSLFVVPNMISVSAYPGHKPVMKGSDVVTGWKKYKGDIWVRENWEVNSQLLFANGKILDQIGGTMADGHVSNTWKWKYKDKTLIDMVPGSFYYDLKEKKLYAWLKNNGDPNSCLMEAAVRTFLVGIRRGLEEIKISGLTLRHVNNYGTEYALAVGGKYCTVRDIDQSWAGFGGGMVGGEYNTVINCRFNHNGNNGMGGRGRGQRIIDCETSYNNNRNWSRGWHSGGVKFVSACHDWTLKGHLATYNNSFGIWFDARMSNVTIEGCTSFRNIEAGIHYEIGSRAVIKNNICYENGGRGIYISNSSYCLVTNNLCYRNAMSGIVSIGVVRPGMYPLNRGTGILPSGHNVITGNIMVDNCDGKNLMKDCQTWPMSPYFKELYTAFLSKIKTWGDRPELIMPDPRDEPANAGCYSDYNIFYRSGERGKNPKSLTFGYANKIWDVGYGMGLEDWRAKTGFDKNSIVAEPKFKNLAEYDFHPASDCPSQWFMTQYDYALVYDHDKVKRPHKPTAHTAGPYSGDIKLYEKLKKAPLAGKYAMFPIKCNGPRWAGGWYILMDLLKSFKVAEVAKLQRGIKIDGIPFAVTRSNALFFSEKYDKKYNLESEKLVKELYFMLTAESSSDKPVVRCTIHRGDGVKITFDWVADGKGGLKTSPEKNLTTKVTWKGQCKIHRKKAETVERSVFTTTWKNDNEWLPVNRIEFERLDKNANIAIFGVTGLK